MTTLTAAKKALKAAQAEVDRLEAEAARIQYATVGGFLGLLEEIIKVDGRLPLWAEGRWIGDFCSWRGSYDDAAIGAGWNGSLSAIGLRNRISDALKNCEVFEGYKGGGYTFTESTPLRVDDHGSYTGTKSVEGYRVLSDRVELLVFDGDPA